MKYLERYHCDEITSRGTGFQLANSLCSKPNSREQHLDTICNRMSVVNLQTHPEFGVKIKIKRSAG